MATKTKKKRFVHISDAECEDRVYRVTFAARQTDYRDIMEDIRGYGEILREEIEIED